MEITAVAMQNKTLQSYLFPSLLLLSIVGGGAAGYWFPQEVKCLKPLGDIFLNLIFTVIVPLIFFSVSSAIAKAGSLNKLGKIMGSMAVVFVLTGFIAALYALLVVKLFPPAQGVYLPLPPTPGSETVHFSEQLVGMFTVPDFSQLLSHHHMLALIVFSILIGLALTHHPNPAFFSFLKAGDAVFMRVFTLIMRVAPFGFFAYFAVLVSELGPQLLSNYLRIAVLYSACALIYFVIGLSGYAFVAGKKAGLVLFWKNMLLPATTALATCSSAASIPANLYAARAMRVPSEITETVIPLGTLIHKDGSVIGGVFKIAFLFGLFHLDFNGLAVLTLAVGVSVLVGTVMGAIPSGGMLGELLILNVYGFPPSVLIAVAAISIIIDPVATLLNVTTNTASSLMITRLVEGKGWLSSQALPSPPEVDDAPSVELPSFR
ncbi:proton/sodium-glutamate symport protein [Legionella rubrilucens]|uniref:Proton/sodium-glutamate symport protein n=1 Tax=Legionella rubrilucens TaxID=458 RepID=A0A0W0XYW9_9GAMM|nr:dicarboxylate/amino acid:cation symporter [Legionella rubrilucens]KTD49459.1 proton/sodium-glutamate symport protein [Legionella rubrilucens]